MSRRTPVRPEETVLYRFGRWTARRRRLILLVWLVAAIAIGVAAYASGARFSSSISVPGTDSQRAVDLLKEEFPDQAGTSGTIVFHSDTASLRAPAAAAAVARTLSRVDAQPHVTAVTSPLRPGGALTADGRTGYAAVQYDRDFPPNEETPLRDLRRAGTLAQRAGLTVEYGGPVADLGQMKPPKTSEAIGIGAAFLILALTFGSVLAAGLPIVTALAGLVCGAGIITLATVLLDQMPEQSMLIAAMVGLGAGIDYALFVITRVREHLAGDAPVDHAIGMAMATAGESVLFAGGTVMIAILGLWVTGIPLVAGLGTACAIAVALVLLASVTLLPAALAMMGRNIDRWRLPARRRHPGPRPEPRPDSPSDSRPDSSPESRPDSLPDSRSRGDGWARWGALISRHRLLFLLVPIGLLVLLALPAFAMRLGIADAGTQPPSHTQRRAYDLVSTNLGPGANGPLLLAVRLPRSGDDAARLRRLGDGVRRIPGVAAVSRPLISRSRGAAVIRVTPATSPRSMATERLVHRLRDGVDQIARDGLEAHVGGATAFGIDLGTKVRERLPWFAGAVAAASFVVLIVVFRAVLVPAKAALLNLLSVGAAYGTVVAVFQWGWGRDVLGLTETVPIYPFVPPVMFALLFGLSMDYEVFLVSRIREEYRAGAGTLGSVVNGTAATAKIISSAALIMMAVFAAFIVQPDPTVKLFGFGLAVAVLLDATIVRMIIVPAAMALAGVYNWWLPQPPKQLRLATLRPATAGAPGSAWGLRLPTPRMPLRRRGDGRRPFDDRKYEASFRMLDRNRDGFVDRPDMQALATRMSEPLECGAEQRAAVQAGFMSWWEQLRSAMDANDDGRVSLAEYLTAVRSGAAADPGYADAGPGKAFLALARAVDRDGNGCIDYDEYRVMFRGGGLDEDDIRSGWRKLDLDGDGEVTVAEFMAALREFFSGAGRTAAGSHLLGRL